MIHSAGFDTHVSERLFPACCSASVKRSCLLLLCGCVLCFAACSSDAIVVTGISPQEMVSDLPDLTLTTFGRNFDRSCQIILNGQSVETTFVNSSELVSHVDLSAMTFAFTADHTATLQVTVRAPEHDAPASSQNLIVRENPVFDPAFELADPLSALDSYSLPELAIGEAGVLYLMWHRGEELFFSASSNQGRTWSAHEDFSRLFGMSGNHDPSMAAVATGTLYVVWTQTQDQTHSSQPSRIYLSHADEQGKRWAEPQLLAESETYSAAPRIMASAQGRVAIIFRETSGGVCRLILLQSGDGGGSWNRSVILEGYYALFEAPEPISLSVDDSGALFVTYLDNYQTRYGHAVCYKVSSDAGQSWGGKQQLLSFGGRSKGIVAAERGRVYASGTDMYLPYTSHSVFLRSSDSGASWIKTPLSEGFRRSALARGSEGMLHLCMGNVFRRIGENGTRLFRERPYTDQTVNDVRIVLDSQGNIFIVWQDESSPYGVSLIRGRLQG